MLRLIETDFAPARKSDLDDRTPSGFLYVGTPDTLLPECRDLGLEIATHEIEFVPVLLFFRRFLEVYVNASLGCCIARDPKGLYARALQGQIQNFTGIDDPYEAPIAPQVECWTDSESCYESAARVLGAILEAQQLYSQCGQKC